jgi:serine/threonine protein kinase/WD40 repeat protein
VRSELWFSWKRYSQRVSQSGTTTVGLGPKVEAYLQLFPVLRADTRHVLELAREEYKVRHLFGDRPEPGEYRHCFPSVVRTGREVECVLQTTQVHRARRTTLPGYEIVGQLGKGGRGVVFLARHKALKRLVAVKTIRADRDDTDMLARFRAEAEAVARLRHPNVVQVHTLEEHDGQLFLVLEYVEGGSLQRQLDGTPLTPILAASLVEHLAGALHAAHAAGVVHRDLKPGNVLLSAACGLAGPPEAGTPRPPAASQAAQSVGSPSREWPGTSAPAAASPVALAPGGSATAPAAASSRGAHATPLALYVPKVTDFGLARRLDQEGHTRTGAVMGTPSYMAPEQASGSKDVGPAADIWALGAILYELLTGRPPFKGAMPTETLDLVQTQEPVPPRRLNPGAPRDLEVICLKCLHKEPATRYSSASEFADDLARWRKGEPIRARPVGPLERTSKWVRRHPALTGLLAATSLFLVVAAGRWLAVLGRRAAEARRLAAEQEQRHARADAIVAEVRALHRSNEPEAPARIEALLEEHRDLREQAGQGDPARWRDRAIRLREEVAPWLLRARLRRGAEMPLPAGPEDGLPPVVAIAPQRRQVAVVYPGARHVHLLGPDGKSQGTLEVPADVAERARSREVQVRVSLSRTQTQTNVHARPSRLAFADEALEYQVDQELVRWRLPSGTPQRQRLPAHRRPHPLFDRWNARGEHFTATVLQGRTVVALRGWAKGARTVPAWWAEGGDPAAGGEQIEHVAFGPDGRSLFVLSNRHLAVLDAESGLEAERGRGREMVSCAGGVALVERGAGRLVFWNVSRPPAPLRTLRWREPAGCVNFAGAGEASLLASGGPDGVVRAWRGSQRLWSAGIAYLGQKRGRPSWRAAGLIPAGPFSRTFRTSGPSDRPSVRRALVEEAPAGPEPYPQWLFLPHRDSDLFVWKRRQTEEPAGRVVQALTVAFDGGDSRGEEHLLWLRWSDGRQLDSPPSREEVVEIQRDLLGIYGLLVWKGPEDLSVQQGLGGKRVGLEGTADFARADWPPATRGSVRWPARGRAVLALAGPRSELWDAATGRALTAFTPGHACLGFDGTDAWALTAGPDSKAVAVGPAKGGKAVHQGRLPEGFSGPRRGKWDLASDGRHLALVSQGVLQVWDLEKGIRALPVPRAGHVTGVAGVAQHAGAGLVASGGLDGVVLLWDRETGKLRHTILAQAAPLAALAFSANGRSLAAGGEEGVSLWSVAGQRRWARSLRTPVTCLTFDPRTPALLAGTRDGRVLSLDVETGKQTAEVRAPGNGGAVALALSPGGTRLAGGTAAGTVHLADAEGQHLASWPTHTGVAGLAFLGEELLATAGQSIQLWQLDGEPGQPAWSVEVAAPPVAALALNEETGELAVADQAGVQVYPLPDLHARLRKWRLGFADFLEEKWPRRARNTCRGRAWGTGGPGRRTCCCGAASRS